MIKQIFVGIVSEGKTDNRFLESVVKRAFDEIGFECNGEIETFLKFITINKSDLGFVEQVLEASRIGKEEFGIMVLCVHSDADNVNDSDTFNNKIIPAKIELNKRLETDYCKILTPIIPVQMIEAWMLADKELLKKEIGTNKTDSELGIIKQPENITDPKTVIENVIRIARTELTKRRRKDLSIGELYLPIGQKIEIKKLDSLPSFLKFKESIRDAYHSLNYLQ